MKKKQVQDLVMVWYSARKKKIQAKRDRDIAVTNKKPKDVVGEHDKKHSKAVIEELKCLQVLEEYAKDCLNEV